MKRPISFDLDNRVSGRARIEKKINRKKKYTVGLRSETFLLTFATRNVSEKTWSLTRIGLREIFYMYEKSYLLVTLSL